MIGKLLERLLNVRMENFFDSHTLLCTYQRDMRGHVLNICYVFLEEITKLIDEGSPVYSIYLDFQKAFDNGPH